MKPRRRFPSLIALFLTLVLIQLVPVRRTNPPIETEIATPGHIKAILRKACYDCHSNTTRWPWYSSIAPVSWLVAGDVTRGREELNFTTWNRYTPKKQASLRKDVWKQVEEGHMTPRLYRLMHPEARLAHAEKEVLRWTALTLLFSHLYF
ncbi:MAG TPA: heme-binding domain-containing protein [Geobacteraceae bacterium]|nr:heme-binding domain-containing protein [Geobacteraceae bacterium]